ncbi:hypothetical protein [Insolitispirillum peregrinum]|uniref:hypothetical protein n=1 Tax=Insolitispirillum peregrinum TaxID=80876 RepID=UPI001FEA5918|nr:hypothetical protein [Insolitispirillum peregrinum]
MGSDAANILELTEHALNEIMLLVSVGIKEVPTFPHQIVENYREYAAFEQKLA